MLSLVQFPFIAPVLQLTNLDILARYLILLGTTTSEFAASAGRIHAELDDVRLALEHVSLVLPLNVFNDPNDDDTRGIDSLIEWFRGPQASQMRRVAGYAGATIAGAQPAEVETGVKNEEWLTGELSTFLAW